MENKHYINPNANSGRFAEYEEIANDYSYVEYNDSLGEPNQYAGLGIEVKKDLNGDVIGAIVDGSDTNTIIVSSTGAGKTRRVLSQYLLSCIYASHSFIVHDPKGELYGFFYNSLKKKGYEINVLNFREPMTGDRLNFLEEAAKLWKAGKEGRAIEIARGIAETLYLPLEDKNDKFWTQTAINLFLCYFIVASNIMDPEYVTLDAIYNIHIQGCEKMGNSSKMIQYLEANKGKMCYELGMPSWTAANETRQSIFSVFSNGLSRIILNEDIQDMLTKSSFEVSELVSEQKPMALFIVTRDESPQTYSTVVSAIVDMIYTTLIELAHSKYNNILPRTCHFLLEEFGNLSKLSNINDMMTASRSRNIRIVLVVQSLCQLYINYSKELARVLIGNAQNLVYMSSTDMELVETISKRCGTVIDEYTHETRRLLSPDHLTHLDKKKGETLFLLDRHYPYVTFLPDLSAYKMIEPLERVKFKERSKLKKEEVDFTKIVEDIRDRKLYVTMEERKAKEKEKDNKQEMSKKEMLTVPDELLVEMNRIIQST